VLVLPDADVGYAEAVVAKLRAITPRGETFSAAAYGGADGFDQAPIVLAVERLGSRSRALY
jgi:hypothetical protein